MNVHQMLVELGFEPVNTGGGCEAYEARNDLRWMNKVQKSYEGAPSLLAEPCEDTPTFMWVTVDGIALPETPDQEVILSAYTEDGTETFCTATTVAELYARAHG